MSKPDFISGANKNSFAYFTLHQRLPHIVSNVISCNHLNQGQVQELNQLSYEVLNGYISKIDSLTVAEHKFWDVFFEQELGKTYYEIPFFKAEAYFYRRIIEIMGYPGKYADPFRKSKQDNITENISFIKRISALVQDETNLEVFLKAILWGNSADLSQIDTGGNVSTNETERGSLIIDNTKAVEAFMHNDTPMGRIDYVADNAGIELLTDLFFIDYLISHYHTKQVVLHLKNYPTFVSDATIDDTLWVIDYLSHFKSESMERIAFNLKRYIDEKRLILNDDIFWNSPCHFTELPVSLKREFSSSSLIIFKGDANYRRLFEDRNWPMTESVHRHLNYFTSDLLVIRTLKSEIMLGLSEKQILSLNQLDKNWLVNGKHGIVMFQEYPYVNESKLS